MKVTAILKTGPTEELLEIQKQYNLELSQNNNVKLIQAYTPIENTQVIGKLISCRVEKEKLIGVLELEDDTFNDFTDRLNDEYYGLY